MDEPDEVSLITLILLLSNITSRYGVSLNKLILFGPDNLVTIPVMGVFISKL